MTRARPLDPPSLATPSAASCCEDAAAPAADDHAAPELARVFKALGDPTRVRLVALIAASQEGEMCLCDLTGPIGLSQPTVSHHARLLVEAGLLTREQRGRWAYYRFQPEVLAAATTALTA